MTHSTRTILTVVLVVLILAAFPVTALAATQPGVVIGNSYTLEAGQTLNDDLLIIGGNVDFKPGSQVNGNVLLIGGALTAEGTIHGDLSVLGGTAKLTDSFILNGNLTTAGSSVDRRPGAQVNGQVNNAESNPQLTLPGGIRITDYGNATHPVLRVLGFFLRLFLWTLIAMLVVMFVPDHLERSAQAALSQPLVSGGMGLLTVVVAPILIVLLAITICLIPAAILSAFILVAAWAFGLIALGYELGKRIVASLKQSWHPALTAGLGVLTLMTVLNTLEAVLPCVGWIPKALIGLVGLGAVILTQFGRHTYTPAPSLPAGETGNPIPMT